MTDKKSPDTALTVRGMNHQEVSPVTAVEDNDALDVIEGEVQDLVPVGPPPTLFRTDNPVEMLTRATEVADALADVIRRKALFTRIQRKEYVHVEGWQTAGTMLGLTAICVWTRPLADGWEARVEVRTLDGRTVGAAEAQCIKGESGTWKANSNDNAVRSMAQTRATSKALRSVLAFVMTLAGYEATPAEEVEDGQTRERTEIRRPAPAIKPTVGAVEPTEAAATGRQKGMLNGQATKAGLTAAQYADCILAASGAEAREWADEDTAAAWIKRALDRLPASLVDSVKDEIGKAKS